MFYFSQHFGYFCQEIVFTKSNQRNDICENLRWSGNCLLFFNKQYTLLREKRHSTKSSHSQRYFVWSINFLNHFYLCFTKNDKYPTCTTFLTMKMLDHDIEVLTIMYVNEIHSYLCTTRLSRKRYKQNSLIFSRKVISGGNFFQENRILGRS